MGGDVHSLVHVCLRMVVSYQSFIDAYKRVCVSHPYIYIKRPSKQIQVQYTGTYILKDVDILLGILQITDSQSLSALYMYLANIYGFNMLKMHNHSKLV
jgi:hypothetical protein